MADHIPQLVQGVRGSQAKPEDLSAQLALIIASQNFLQVRLYSLTISHFIWRLLKLYVPIVKLQYFIGN